MEKFHAAGACLDNEIMQKLNKDIHNRFYTLLNIWFNETGNVSGKVQYLFLLLWVCERIMRIYIGKIS